jgi:hypothetical protein
MVLSSTLAFLPFCRRLKSFLSPLSSLLSKLRKCDSGGGAAAVKLRKSVRDIEATSKRWDSQINNVSTTPTGVISSSIELVLFSLLSWLGIDWSADHGW